MSSRKICALAAVGLLALAGAGTHAAASGRAAPAAPALVTTASAHILVDAHGMSLYVYAPDKKNKSVCTGKCAQFWPPLTVTSGTTVPTTMSGLSGTFGTTMRADGTQQLTYDGAPLYRFVEDKKPGDMTGQGLYAAGGYWWLVVVKTTAKAYRSGY